MLSLKKHRGPLSHYGYYETNRSYRWDSRTDDVYLHASCGWVYLRKETRFTTEWNHKPTYVVIKNKAYFVHLLDKFTESLHNTLRLSSSTTGN